MGDSVCLPEVLCLKTEMNRVKCKFTRGAKICEV